MCKNKPDDSCDNCEKYVIVDVDNDLYVNGGDVHYGIEYSFIFCCFDAVTHVYNRLLTTSSEKYEKFKIMRIKLV